MSNLTDLPETPKLDAEQMAETDAEQASDELKRVAEKAAEAASKTEQRYDREHNIFSK